MTKRLLALSIALAFASTASVLAAPSRVTVLARGQCAHIGPVAGPGTSTKICSRQSADLARPTR